MCEEDMEKAVNAGNGIRIFSEHILFYAEITPETTLDLVVKLREVDNQLQWDGFRSGVFRNIVLHLNTPGGCLDCAFSIVDTFSQLSSPVTTIVEGVCASAGTVISVAGNNRLMTINSQMLIHPFRGYLFGERYPEMEDHMKGYQDTQDLLINHYKKYTGLSKKEIRKILKRETWYKVNDAIKLNLVDGKI